MNRRSQMDRTASATKKAVYGGIGYQASPIFQTFAFRSVRTHTVCGRKANFAYMGNLANT